MPASVMSEPEICFQHQLARVRSFRTAAHDIIHWKPPIQVWRRPVLWCAPSRALLQGGSRVRGSLRWCRSHQDSHHHKRWSARRYQVALSAPTFPVKPGWIAGLPSQPSRSRGSMPARDFRFKCPGWAQWGCRARCRLHMGGHFAVSRWRPTHVGR